MSAVKERICDRRLLKLLGAFLHAGVLEDGSVRRPVSGTPQGGVISPVLGNVYLHRLDRAWRSAYGTLVRYADALLVLWRSRGQAQAALARLRRCWPTSGCSPRRPRRESCT
jgi:RNA-directed DNA polymerase